LPGVLLPYNQQMRQSTHKILTTHVGSLPAPESLTGEARPYTLQNGGMYPQLPLFPFIFKEVVKALLFEHSVVLRDGFVKLRPE